MAEETASSSIVLGFPADSPTCAIRVNRFPVSARFATPYRGKQLAGITHYVIVDPYYLRPGKNVVTSECALSVASLELPDDTQGKLIAKATPDHGPTDFTLGSSRRAWAWTAGEPRSAAVDHKPALYAAYQRLFAELGALHQHPAEQAAYDKVIRRNADEYLRAQLMLPRPTQHVDHLLKLATLHGDRKPETLRPTPLPSLEACDAELLAGGIARLTARGNAIVRYAGGRHDAPDGIGPTDVAFDVWFRWDGKAWIVDAIQQTYDNPRSVYSFVR